MLPASHRPFNEGPTRTFPFWYVGSVSLTNNQKVLVLIGLMGAGKTSVGRKLAEHLNMRLSTPMKRLLGPPDALFPIYLRVMANLYFATLRSA